MRQGKQTTKQQIEQMREEIAREKINSEGIRVPLSPKKRMRRVLNIVGQVFFAGLLVVLVFSLVSVNIAKSKSEVPKIFGEFSLFVVESGSMEPTLTVGSVILSRMPADAKSLNIGDVVTFRTVSDYVVTHRIVEIIDNGSGGILYRTKGDNPVNSPDKELLSPDRVIGVLLLKIPFT